jgi:NOL1/NOP2/fmu family ribosome biogenesis protein
MKGDTVTVVPVALSADIMQLESYLHVLAAGCAVGVMKGDTLVPDADHALSIILDTEAYPSAELDRNKALAYLHRDAIVLQDSPKGFILVRYEGLPLGFVKNLGNRCNNLHPQSRRIRMDINR